MKKRDENKYMNILDKVLEKATIKNKYKILQVLQKDYSRKIITGDTYLKASKKLEQYFNKIEVNGNKEENKSLEVLDEGER